jgi:undecaprenyl pyrophosphate phosphatase UppP
MSQHLTYLEAVVTGLVQGVTELFPVSSLGHNVLIPALVGGSWASTLNVSAPNSPYLAFIVGLHVATAIAMIVYFWRDWLRIVRGFFTSLRTRSITTPDERLAWMIILATIPVGIVGAALQHEFIKVFAKPELAAVFLAINGVILLVSERMRRSRDAAGGGTATVVLPAGQAVPSGPVPGPPGRGAWGPGGPAAAPGGPGWGGGPGTAGAPGGPAGGWAPGGRPGPGGPGPEGYSQQPWQQQRQGPDPRYGQDGNPQYPGNGQGEEYGRRPQPPYGQPPQGGQPQGGPGQYGPDPRGGQPGPGWPPAGDPRGGGYDPRDPRAARDQQRPGGRHAGGHSSGHGGHGGGHGGHAAGGGGHAAGQGGRRPAEGGGAVDEAVAADRRLSTMGYKRAVIVGSVQILALLPGISRDGIVTVAGMGRGLTRQDAVRFSFLLSAPVILAAGALKAKDLTGPLSAGIHGPIIVGSLISGIGAYLSIRFLTKYFSEEKSLSPFGVYCLIAGLGSLAYLLLK